MRGAQIRLLNLGLRCLTLCVRFLFIFFLARYLDPVQVGYYGLFTAAIGYCIYFVGLDFYTYMTREILATAPEQRGRLLKAQLCLSTALFLVISPIVIIGLWYAGWPSSLIWWFLPILVCEYLNQEIYRLLIALSRQIAASILLFLRQGLWAIAVLALMLFVKESRTLVTVMALWGSAGIATVGIGVWLIGGMGFGGWREVVDWNWLRRGIVVSMGFLIATLALRGFQALDRFWLENIAGLEAVAAYVLFLGVAGVLMTFLDAGVFAFGCPELIRLHLAGDKAQARKTIRQMLIQTIAVSAGFGVASWLALPLLLDGIGNPVYFNHREIYPLLVLAMTINALGMVPHFALYATRRDRPIIQSHLAALPAFVIVTWVSTRVLPVDQGLFAVPLGLNAAFLLILIWKAMALLNSGDTDSVSHPEKLKIAQSP